MYSIRKSIGDDEYTATAARGFTKIFSRILDVIIPIVIRFEVENPAASSDIANKRANGENTLVVSTNKASAADGGTDSGKSNVSANTNATQGLSNEPSTDVFAAVELKQPEPTSPFKY